LTEETAEPVDYSWKIDIDAPCIDAYEAHAQAVLAMVKAPYDDRLMDALHEQILYPSIAHLRGFDRSGDAPDDPQHLVGAEATDLRL
jgi:hypothetical protein